MSIQPPQGILTIPNATLRVGRLQVDEVEGFDTVLNTFDKNTILEEDSEVYDDDKKWGVKMPNIFVATFEIKGGGSSFNFRNTSNGDATTGYTLTFSGTTLTLKYNNASLTTATIPNLDSVYGKVYVTYEKQHFTVTVDGTLVLTYKDATTRTPPEGEYANFFAGTGSPGFKNLKVVAGHFISDGTSNVSLFGGLAVTSNLEVGSSNLFVDTQTSRVGVGTNTPKEALDVVGNMHLTRVSNVSQIKVDSNVVTEYTGPHDRPLRKYPEVALTANDNSSTSGYVADQSSTNGFADGLAYRLFDHSTTAYQSGGAFSGGIATGSNPITTASDESTHQGVAITLDLATKIRLSYAKITSHTFYGRTPAYGSFLGSNDNTTWELIGTFAGLSTTAVGQTHTVHIADYASKSAYRYIRLVVTRTSDSLNLLHGGTLLEFRELEYYGHEEGSGSLDTTLKSVYNVPATTGTQLEVYYDAKDLADGAVTSVEDLSPNSNGGLPSDSPQISNGAFVFDGVNDYIYNSQSGYTSGNTYTGSAWIKKTSNTNGCVFQFGNGSNGNSFGIFYYGGTIDYVRAYVFGYALANSNSGSIPLNEWIHVTGVYSGKTATLYINGIEVATNTGSTDITIPSTPYLTIGAQTDNTNTPYTGTYFTGSIANFRLYSKALNADQVKELYEYQKDYFLGSKSQVTLYKGHLGVGVTEPSGQLELAGDERIQEYPPRGMTDFNTYIEGQGVFTASATTYGATSATKILYHPWKAFNKDRTDANGGDNAWLNGPAISGGDYNTATGVYEGTEKHHEGAPIGAALQLSMPYEIYLKGYSLAPWNYAAGGDFQYADSPSDFIIYGSKDNVNWKQIDSRTGQGMTSQADIKRFSLDTQDSYSHFAIVVTKNNTAAYPSTDASFLAIEEWRLFGTPGPTTLDKGSLSLGRSLDVPRVSRYDVDTETPRPEKLLVDFDTTVNSSPTDISGKGNHGTLVGATYSPADKAFVFDGGDDINVELPSSVTGAYVHSMSLWFTHSGTGNSLYTLVHIGDVNNSENVMSDLLVYDTGKLRFGFYDNDSDTAVGLINLNQWYHVVVTYSGGTGNAGSRKLYLNGEEISLTLSGNFLDNSLSLPPNPKLYLGSQQGSLKLTGQISNFKLYDTVLEPSEVKKLYNLGRTGRSMVISDTAVGIGKVPEAQLDVRGTLRSDGLTVGGDIYATGNITGYSDRRAKSDIEKIENALEKIEQLNGYTFTMKGKRYTGLIAQEILPILPEAVSGSEETNYAVAYGNMMGLIVEAIKELKQKIG
jgi:hypothetical protein